MAYLKVQVSSWRFAKLVPKQQSIGSPWPPIGQQIRNQNKLGSPHYRAIILRPKWKDTAFHVCVYMFVASPCRSHRCNLASSWGFARCVSACLGIGHHCNGSPCQGYRSRSYLISGPSEDPLLVWFLARKACMILSPIIVRLTGICSFEVLLYRTCVFFDS